MSATASSDIARVYVWERPVRLTHWCIALSIAVLAATGLYIGHPVLIVTGPAGQHFVMGWAKVIHFYAAMVFTLSVVARIVWMFLGNQYARWSEFIPVSRARRSRFLPTVQFYLFLRRKPPAVVGHNPLAGLTYVLVYGLCFTAIITGLAMYSVSAGSLMHRFGFLIPFVGGLQTARWIHHIVMWLLLGFAVHHVYSAILMSSTETNATMESIFSGYKFIARDQLTSAAKPLHASGPQR
jgi:Ni/Fe-hydrogenase 1 B-type cytochrome subunit